MANPPRIEYPGAVYHVAHRGNNRRVIYLDDYDKIMFLELLLRSAKKKDVKISTLTLMENHYHLQLKTLTVGLSKFMMDLNPRYSRYFNRKYGMCGSLFGRPYKAKLIEDDIYYCAVADYIIMNSVRAGLVDDPWQHPYTWHEGNGQPLDEWVKDVSGIVVRRRGLILPDDLSSGKA